LRDEVTRSYLRCQVLIDNCISSMIAKSKVSQTRQLYLLCEIGYTFRSL